MNNTPPIINNAAVFIAEQYKQLSPNWDILTREKKVTILSKLIPEEGVLLLSSEDEITIASKYYILQQSGFNHDVAELLGVHQMFKDVPIA